MQANDIRECELKCYEDYECEGDCIKQVEDLLDLDDPDCKLINHILDGYNSTEEGNYTL